MQTDILKTVEDTFQLRTCKTACKRLFMGNCFRNAPIELVSFLKKTFLESDVLKEMYVAHNWQILEKMKYEYLWIYRTLNCSQQFKLNIYEF